MKFMFYGTLLHKDTLDSMIRRAAYDLDLEAEQLQIDTIKAFVQGTIYNVGAFPCVFLDGNTQVHGAIVDIKSNVPGFEEAICRSMDRYEGVPTLYTRETVTAVDSAGNKHQVQMYVAGPSLAGRRDDLRLIESGKFCECDYLD